MSIEQGIAMRVQGDATVANIAATGGGYLSELPPNQQLPSWSFFIFSEMPQYGLVAQPGLVFARLQVDCYGTGAAQGADCIQLAAAIDKSMSGFRGTLPDPDATKIDGCFRIDKRDFFDSTGRTYRRMLEYELSYFTQI